MSDSFRLFQKFVESQTRWEIPVEKNKVPNLT